MTITHPYCDSVRQWASGEDAIRALVITGSQARADGSTDSFSDLDAQIITTDIRRYTDDDRWLHQIGEVWIRFPLYKDVPYRLVWFSGGSKVDFQFLDIGDIKAMIASGELSDEYKRGYRVLFDKDELFRRLPPSPRLFPQPPPPSAEAVQAIINEFWFEAIHVAQFIRRREFWLVKHRDWTMKTDLLQMMEWHARETRATPVNTWLLGKRIKYWADDAAYAAINRIWAAWDATALWDAFILQLELFRRLSQELTQALQYNYDADIYREIETYIGRLWREDGTTTATD